MGTLKDRTLKDLLHDDLTAAIKARDEVRVATLRLVLAAITTEEVAGAVARELSDDDARTVVAREAKRRREAAQAFAAGGRPELAERERAEEAVLAEYLPEQMSDEELAALVTRAIGETGASGPAVLGAVMKVVRPRVGGRADGARLAAEVRRQLAAS
ncbi:MAG TPA: GatB/YqeY domain-containing protein [Mycobacteriales bacterium]|nr:GatB/YqeY domain-containing protein [Mycobacteriales bacterium]